MISNVRWVCGNDDVEIINISDVERLLGVKLPKDYIEIVLRNDGGYPKPNRFKVNGYEEIFNNLLSFDKEECSYLIDTYNDVSDRLVKGVVPFAEDPFGNLICFDYRKNEQPVVIFWEHEKAFDDKELAISYLCDTFTELVLMLHEHRE